MVKLRSVLEELSLIEQISYHRLGCASAREHDFSGYRQMVGVQIA